MIMKIKLYWAFIMGQMVASLMVHAVKNVPAIPDTWVQVLSWEDPLETGLTIHSSILAWRIHGERSLVDCSHWGHRRVQHHWLTLSLSLSWVKYSSKQFYQTNSFNNHNNCFIDWKTQALFPLSQGVFPSASKFRKKL